LWSLNTKFWKTTMIWNIKVEVHHPSFMHYDRTFNLSSRRKSQNSTPTLFQLLMPSNFESKKFNLTNSWGHSLYACINYICDYIHTRLMMIYNIWSIHWISLVLLLVQRIFLFFLYYGAYSSTKNEIIAQESSLHQWHSSLTKPTEISTSLSSAQQQCIYLYHHFLCFSISTWIVKGQMLFKNYVIQRKTT